MGILAMGSPFSAASPATRTALGLAITVLLTGMAVGSPAATQSSIAKEGAGASRSIEAGDFTGTPQAVLDVLKALPGTEPCVTGLPEPGEIDVCMAGTRIGFCNPLGGAANCRIRTNPAQCPEKPDVRHGCDGQVLPILNACRALEGQACMAASENLACHSIISLEPDPDCDGDNCETDYAQYGLMADDGFCCPINPVDPLNEPTGVCACPTNPYDPGIPDDACKCPSWLVGAYYPACVPPPKLPPSCSSAAQFIVPYSEFNGNPALDYYDISDGINQGWGWWPLHPGLTAHRNSGITQHHSVSGTWTSFSPAAYSGASSWRYRAYNYYSQPAYAGSDLPGAMNSARQDLLSLNGGYSDLTMVLITTGVDLSSSATPATTISQQAALAKAAGIRVAVIHVEDGYNQPVASVWDHAAELQGIASYGDPLASGGLSTVHFYYPVGTAQDVPGAMSILIQDATVGWYSQQWCAPNVPAPPQCPTGTVPPDCTPPCPTSDPTCVLDPCPAPLTGSGTPYCFGSCPSPISGPAMPSCAGVCVGESEWCPSEACVYRSVAPPPPLNPNLQVCAASVVSCMAGDPVCDATRPYLQLIVGGTDVCVGAYCYPALVCERDALTGTKCI